MGASDTIEADVPCPHCGDIYYLNWKTDFFEPSYAEQRTLEPGEPHPLARMPGRRSTWTRVRPTRSDDRFTVLADPEHMVRCACGYPGAPVLHFVRGPSTIMLERVELVDARTDVASHVDFAVGGREIAATLAATFAEAADLGQWTALAGPTRCEACGEARERTHYTLLAHPRARVGRLFGTEWQGRAIMIGDRVASTARPRDAAITIFGDRGSWGCGCGAGPAGYVARFERDGANLVLVDLALSTADRP